MNKLMAILFALGLIGCMNMYVQAYSDDGDCGWDDEGAQQYDDDYAWPEED